MIRSRSFTFQVKSAAHSRFDFVNFMKMHIANFFGPAEVKTIFTRSAIFGHVSFYARQRSQRHFLAYKERVKEALRILFLKSKYEKTITQAYKFSDND